jgi:hypothetical protein
MTLIRQAMALDLVARLQNVDGVRTVVLSDDPSLLQEASRQGGLTQVTRPPFSWLEEVKKAVREHAADEQAVLVMGGAAAPLLTEAGVARLRDLAEPGVVWQNNRLSPDLVLFQPAARVEMVTVCQTDNDFGYALEQQAGMSVQYLPREISLTFDVDTPLDAILAAGHQDSGDRLRQSVAGLRHRVPLEAALAVLRRNDYPDVALIGRAHPVEAENFAQGTGVRLRLYSEERGMKALGRIESGEVRSLVAELLETLGQATFFEKLAGQAACVFWDTRVLFAHHRLALTEEDRYYADLGLFEQVQNAWLSEFTERLIAAPIPILTGGQSLVAGGLRLIAAAATK